MPLPNAYIDLSQNPQRSDFNSSKTNVDGGPNYYGGYTNDSGQFITTHNYYSWIYNSGGQWVYSDSPPGFLNSNTPNSAIQSVNGMPLFNDYMGVGQRNFAAIVAPDRDVTYLKISQVADTLTPIRGTEQLIFDPAWWASSRTQQSDVAPVVFNLSASGVTSTANWVSLPSLANPYDSGPPITGIQARVIQDGTGYAVVARSINNGQVVALNGSEMNAILNSFNFANSSTTPQQSAFTFKVQVSGNTSTTIPTSSSDWVGNAGRSGAADTSVVYFDSLPPTPSDLIVAGDTLILAMNGPNSTWPSGLDHEPSQVAESRWQNLINDDSIIPSLTVRDGSNGQIAITDIQSFWNGYQITLARPVTTTAVSLTYSPVTGSNQLNGVIQDQTGNDAVPFAINANYYVPNGSGINSTATKASFTNSDNASDATYFLTSEIGSDRATAVQITITGTTLTAKFDYAFIASGTSEVNFYTNSAADPFVKQVTTLTATISSSTGIPTGTLTPAQFQSSVDVLVSRLTSINSITIDAVGGRGSSAQTATATANVERMITETQGASLIPLSVINNLGDLVSTLGNDVYTTGNFNDTLYGWGGSDTFSPGLGSDTIYGGTSADSISYSSLTSSSIDQIQINLAAGGNPEVVATLSGATRISTQLDGIENVIGSQIGDTINGNEVNNIITGGLGNDTMSGGAGDDMVVINAVGQPTSGSGPTFTFSAGSNFTISSSDGVDVIANDVELVKFNDRSLSVELSMLQQRAVFISTDGTENADTISGTSGSEEIRALGGDDTIFGSGGYDIINAGNGNDTVSYTRVNLNSPTSGILVQASSDATLQTQNYTVIKPWDYSNNASLTTLSAAGRVDRLVATEYITGTTRADFFIGAQANDWFSGRGGNDTFYGGSGSDWVDYISILPSTFTGSTGVVVNLSGISGSPALSASSPPLDPQLQLTGLNFTGNFGQDLLQGTARIGSTAVNTPVIPVANISTSSDTITVNAHGFVVVAMTPSMVVQAVTGSITSQFYQARSQAPPGSWLI